MPEPTMNDIENKLNDLYGQYLNHLDMVKGLGYKVFRNSDGQHKVSMDTDYLKKVFGGVFNE